MSDKKEKLEAIRQMIMTAERSLISAKAMLSELVGSHPVTKEVKNNPTISAEDKGISKIIEGVFDGEQMVDGEGKTYQVPANYSSKSKLVQGDTLKLTVLDDGTFLYKQIGPVERHNVMGRLVAEDGIYKVEADDKKYRVLYASVTYFRAKPGDNISLIVPKNIDSEWGAIENVIPAG